ncbi:DUF2867 domain-containing protein [Pseudomonas sp. NA-150]|uniref:DUF2867 domain-containing protein n=1 Tax=Pseudomonas sp. NA-150 TaxID=3367525 RepID=UPI0037CB083D
MNRIGPTVTEPVVGSEIYPYSQGASYHDAYRMLTPANNDSMLKLAMQVLGSTPPWINFLMLARNKIVKQLGLKDLGGMSDVRRDKAIEDYRVGDRVGIFTLLYLAENEVILGDADTHLEVRVSVYRQSVERGCALTVATVVHNRNWLGRLYMVFVKPAHRVIVRVLLRRYLQIIAAM